MMPSYKKSQQTSSVFGQTSNTFSIQKLFTRGSEFSFTERTQLTDIFEESLVTLSESWYSNTRDAQNILYCEPFFSFEIIPTKAKKSTKSLMGEGFLF